jgi:hypothetical protein
MGKPPRKARKETTREPGEVEAVWMRNNSPSNFSLLILCMDIANAVKKELWQFHHDPVVDSTMTLLPKIWIYRV